MPRHAPYSPVLRPRMTGQAAWRVRKSCSWEDKRFHHTIAAPGFPFTPAPTHGNTVRPPEMGNKRRQEIEATRFSFRLKKTILSSIFTEEYQEPLNTLSGCFQVTENCSQPLADMTVWGYPDGAVGVTVSAVLTPKPVVCHLPHINIYERFVNLRVLHNAMTNISCKIIMVISFLHSYHVRL